MFGIGIPWFKILIAAAVALVIWLGYKYVTDLQAENDRLVGENATLVANNAQLEQAIADQEEAIAALQRDILIANQLRGEVENEFTKSRNRVRVLEDKLSEHDIGFLAANRPGLVERIINRASDNINRCFEIASGAPLTPAEIEADRPSQFNTECPELANPNWKE